MARKHSTPISASSSSLNQPGQTGWTGGEQSPYGIDLNVQYPVCDHEALIAASQQAMTGWQKAGADGRTGICLEILSIA